MKKLYVFIFLFCTAQSSFSSDGLVFKDTLSLLNMVWAGTSVLLIPCSLSRLEQRDVDLRCTFCILLLLYGAMFFFTELDVSLSGTLANIEFFLIANALACLIDRRNRRERMAEEAIAV